MRNFAINQLLLMLILGTLGCGSGDSSEALENLEDLPDLDETFASLNLSCDFDEVMGDSEVEETDSLELTEDCAEAVQDYTILAEQFDSDGDGVLTDTGDSEEYTEAEEAYHSAQVDELDTNGDGEISDDEKAAFRTDKLPARKERRGERFAKACEGFGKEDSECRGLRDLRKEHYRAELKERLPEFDTDGDGVLSEEERAAMREARRGERKEEREDFRGKHDVNGDGVFGPEDRKQRRESRGDKRPPEGTGPAPKGPADGASPEGDKPAPEGGEGQQPPPPQ